MEKTAPTEQEEREWLREAKGDMELACLMLEEDELAERIKVSFNSRFTNLAGEANYLKMEVRLSAPLWPRMTKVERIETVFHEVCHIIDAHRNGRVKPHGKSWKELMVKCGLAPERTHNIKRSDLYRPVKTFGASCGCGIIRLIRAHRRTKILKGITYQCFKCKGDLKLLE